MQIYETLSKTVVLSGTRFTFTELYVNAVINSVRNKLTATLHCNSLNVYTYTGMTVLGWVVQALSTEIK